MLTPRQVVRSRGLTLTLSCENWITHYRWQTYNSKEPETLDWIDDRIGGSDLVFDIGANVGVYAIYAALRHPGVRVVAFEPEYANLSLLRDNVVANHLQERIEVYSVALSDHVGVSRLHLQDLTPGAALHTESKARLCMTAAQRPVVWREGIYAMTLDRFCEETGLRPNGIKLDVDGTESQVLEGALRALSSPALRSIMIELPADAQARERCTDRLTAAGLRRAWSDPLAKSLNELWVREGSNGRGF